MQRERANLIFGYIEGYQHTADPQWLTELRTVVGPTARLDNKPWLTEPAKFGRANPGQFQSLFQLGQTVWALGRYHDFCEEYGLSDDLGVAKAIRAYADFVINHAMREYKPGLAATPNEYHFDGNQEGTFLEINNWALLTADVLAYAYQVSGDERYLRAAAKFYATGTIDPVWPDDPPVYLGTKDLVNSCNWGLVYMQLQRQVLSIKPAAAAAK